MPQRVGHGGEVIAAVSIGRDCPEGISCCQSVAGGIVGERPCVYLPVGAAAGRIRLCTGQQVAMRVIGERCRLARCDNNARQLREYGIIISNGGCAGLRRPERLGNAARVTVRIVDVIRHVAIPVGLAGNIAVGVIGEALRPCRDGCGSGAVNIRDLRHVLQGHDHEFNQGLTHFIYDQQGNLIAEADSFGGIAKEYVYMGGLPIAELDGENIHYIHTDHLGTPQKMTDAGQKVVWDRDAEPFGKTTHTNGPATLNLRSPGQYHDNESGLDYNFFRSYNPGTGRYTQSDSMGLAAGINTYSYVGGNPVNDTDPSGLYAYTYTIAELETVNSALEGTLPGENNYALAQSLAAKGPSASSLASASNYVAGEKCLFENQCTAPADTSSGTCNANNPTGSPQQSNDNGQGNGNNNQPTTIAGKSKSECIEECWGILEQPFSPGSNKNEWNFTQCVNDCMGVNQPPY